MKYYVDVKLVKNNYVEAWEYIYDTLSAKEGYTFLVDPSETAGKGQGKTFKRMTYCWGYDKDWLESVRSKMTEDLTSNGP